MTAPTITTTITSTVNVEAKSEGAVFDPTGTWLAVAPLPKLQEETLTKWARATITEKHIVRDTRICKGGVAADAQISILLGLPDAPPPSSVIDILQQWRTMRLRLGKLQCFPVERVEIDGVSHSYRVLYAPLVPWSVVQDSVDEAISKGESVDVGTRADTTPDIVTGPLHRLQHLLGMILGGGVKNPITWHHPHYHPHLTLGFINASSADEYIGRSLPSELDTITLDRLLFKRYKDKSVPAVEVRLAPLA